MSKKIELKNIEIKVGEKTLNLSLEQARELKSILTELLPDCKVITEPIYIPARPWWYDYPFTHWDVLRSGTTISFSVGD